MLRLVLIAMVELVALISLGFGTLYGWGSLHAPELDVRERRVIRTMGAGRITFGVGTAALPLFAYAWRWWPTGMMMLGLAVRNLPAWLYRRRAKRPVQRDPLSVDDV